MQPVSLFVVLVFVDKMLRAHHLESYNNNFSILLFFTTHSSHLSC